LISVSLEQTRLGHFVKVLLPSQLSLPELSVEETAIDIETIDFYRNRQYLPSLLQLERGQCFYCLRDINEGSCELDHVESQLNGGGNSYRNIVASCHQCNTKKQGGRAEDHMRQLLRKGLLSEKEFECRVHALEALRDGQIKPEL